METGFNLALGLVTTKGRVKLDRTCLLLGSAPDPHIPKLENFDLLCINCSGVVAKEFGLQDPKVTLMGAFKLVVPKNEVDRRILKGLRTENLVLIRHRLPVSTELATQLLVMLDYSYGKLLRLGFWDRAHIIEKITGEKLLVSNGVFAACYAFYVGAPELILAGFSLTQDGHYYCDQNRRRYHADPDLAALKAMKERGWNIKTTEPELSELTSIPLLEVAVTEPQEFTELSVVNG